MALVVVLPFIVFAASTHNYFILRVDQVSAVSREAMAASNDTAPCPLAQLRERLRTTLRSLYTHGEGGVPGHTFGRRSFFTPLALVLFVSGLLASLYLAVVRDQRWSLYSVVIIGVAFVSGMVMTRPAGDTDSPGAVSGRSGDARERRARGDHAVELIWSRHSRFGPLVHPPCLLNELGIVSDLVNVEYEQRAEAS